MSLISGIRTRIDNLQAPPGWMRWPVLIGQFVLGALFILSGAAKVMDAQSFMATLPLYHLPEWIIPLGTLVPPLEVALGLALVLGIALRPAALAALAMLITFSVLLVIGIMGGELETCGCFGAYLETSPELGLVRNLVLIVLALGLWWQHLKTDATWLPWQAALLAGILLVTGIGTGYTIEAPQSDSSLAQAGEFFPDAGWIDDMPEMEGQQLVFVFAAKCEHCWNAVANIKELAEAGDPPLFAVTPSPQDEIEWFRRTFDVAFPIYRIEPNSFNQAFNYWPALYLLEDGMILGKEEEGVPSLKTFREVTLPDWEG